MSIGKQRYFYKMTIAAKQEKGEKSNSPDNGMKPELAELHDAVVKAC